MKTWTSWMLMGVTSEGLLYDHSADSHPTWPSDGERIAFMSDRDGNDEVHIMDADGSNQMNVTNNPAYDGLQMWSCAIFKKSNIKELVNKDMERNSFPITWRANLFEILYALSKMGHGSNRRLERAWHLLDTRQDNTGRYILDWTPHQSPWKVGKRNEPNEWVTFYAYCAHKFKEGVINQKPENDPRSINSEKMV